MKEKMLTKEQIQAFEKEWFSPEEIQSIIDSWIFDNEEISDYEFVFDKPVKASDLLKTF